MPDWAENHDVASGEPLPRDLEPPLLFVVHPRDTERRRELRERFSRSEERLQPQRFRDRNYLTVFVPR